MNVLVWATAYTSQCVKLEKKLKETLEYEGTI